MSRIERTRPASFTFAGGSTSALTAGPAARCRATDRIPRDARTYRTAACQPVSSHCRQPRLALYSIASQILAAVLRTFDPCEDTLAPPYDVTLLSCFAGFAFSLIAGTVVTSPVLRLL